MTATPVGTPPADSTLETAAGLRSWARGSYSLVAAVELLIRSFRGQFAAPGYPWIKYDVGRSWYWLEAEDLDLARGMSSGERILLDFVAALALGAEEGYHLDLTDIARLDRRHQSLVLAAIAHAGGSYEHTDRAGQRLGSLYPWPQDGK